MSHSEIVSLLIQLCVLLAFGRTMAEVARKYNQAPVIGEILAGIILGPTVLGMISPATMEWLFPTDGESALILDGFVQVSVVLLLFISGLEVDLSVVIQQGRKALYTSSFGLVFPFLLGFVIPYTFPHLFRMSNESDPFMLALFMGTAMSITALPVIARILMDINMFRSKIGMLIISSAMINDLIGWIIFTVILSMIGQGNHNMTLWETVGLTLGFTFFMLTIGKALINKVLPWINNRLAWPGGLISLTMAFCFLGAAFTEGIGIHAIFGAFIVGVALGDSEHFSEKAKEIVHQFVNNIFSPLFFVSIGLKVNFITSFNLGIVLVILIIAFMGKIIGAGFGAYLSGLSRNESLATGFGMNARGAMEIILGLVALEANIINEFIFVALVILALTTSITSGPFMKIFMKS